MKSSVPIYLKQIQPFELNEIPTGLRGQLLFIQDNADNEIELDFLFRKGNVVENQVEFDLIAQQGISLGEVFRNWKLFSHYFGSVNDPIEAKSPPSFPAFLEGSVGITPEEFYNNEVWRYSAESEALLSEKNYQPYTGYISPYKYSNYNLEATLSSTNSDDDWIGVVIGFFVDPETGYEHTLSVLRTLRTEGGVVDGSFQIVYNFSQDPAVQQVIIDGSNLAPVPEGATGWLGNPTRLSVNRTGDVFSIKTSQFGSTLIDDSTEILLNLADHPVLEKFLGSSEIGFSARSQADASVSNIVFNGFTNYIFWKKTQGYETWEFDQATEKYVLQNPKSTFVKDFFGVSRFVDSHKVNNTFYITEKDEIIKVGSSVPAKSARPEKRIPNTTQYTAVKEDATKYLVFEHPVEFIINDGVFAKDDELEGDCEGGDVSVTAGTGVTILKLETQRNIILNNGPFGMRFKAANKLTLMGALKPL